MEFTVDEEFHGAGEEVEDFGRGGVMVWARAVDAGGQPQPVGAEESRGSDTVLEELERAAAGQLHFFDGGTRNDESLCHTPDELISAESHSRVGRSPTLNRRYLPGKRLSSSIAGVEHAGIRSYVTERRFVGSDVGWGPVESHGKLEDLRSVLSCVFERLGAESLTEPDRVELVARAEVVQDQIDAIRDVIDDEERVRMRTMPVPEPTGDRLF
ncbi:hypothetical protein [Nocardia sp. N2S4-5]|uniref:hypothetical protein n=1 Tax=Nocardia sp. N2S4-5 TaxID=3351565 RepID=UPI0037D0440A